jgi:cell fate (sporulation/competence/biofilm development) regulator YlbF (YheA/YmcA/DUF963 family)
VVEESEMSTLDTIPPALRSAAEELAASLELSEPIALFREAKARLDADGKARDMLKRLAELDSDLRRREADGTLTREDIDRLRAVQREAWSDPVIAGSAEAQQRAIGYLPEVNELISALLGWDFASMASAPASC